MPLDCLLAEALATEGHASTDLQYDTWMHLLTRQAQYQLSAGFRCHPMNARPTEQQRQAFYNLVDERRRMSMNQVPEARAVYTDAQRLLFRKNQPIMLRRPTDLRRLYVRRGREVYYLRNEGLRVFYDHFSLEYIAKGRGKDLADNLYYCLIEQRCRDMETNPWVREVHPLLYHAM